MYVAVFDTETTGIPRRGMAIADPAYPRIVELAVALIDPAGEELASVAFVIRPEGFEVPEEAANIHGITTAVAAAIGVPARLALASLTNLCRIAGEIAGHNVSFDLGMVRSELVRLGQRPDLIGSGTVTCTADLGEPVCKLPPTERMKATGYGNKFKRPNLGELYQHLFGEPFADAHRAMTDVRAAARCLIELRRRAA